jgi:hypothetical protein
MNRIYLQATALLIAAAVGGCAADQAEAPAKLIGGEVAKFHADLTQAQDDIKAAQGYSATRINGTALRTATASETTARLQTEWNLQHAKTQTDVLEILRSQAGASATAEAEAAAPLPALTAADFPLDKLSATAGGLDQIATQRDFKEHLKFLIEYGAAVNEQLKKLEEEAAKKTGAGS